MSDVKSGKKRSVAFAVPPAAAGVSTGSYNPGVGFAPAPSCSSIDIPAVQNGSKELWLVQIPKQMSLQSLNGLSTEIRSSASSGAALELGRFSRKDGTGLSIIQEAGLYSQQLWAVAGKGQGLLPITKRLTVERVEGSAVARVSQPSSDEEVEDVEEEEKEDWPRMEVEPEAKRVKKSEKKEKKGKKEKKEKKKDKNRED